MTVMTRKSEKLLAQLVAFAGNPQLVQQALTELNQEEGMPPSLEAVARRILELRNAAVHGGAAASPADASTPATRESDAAESTVASDSR